MKRFWATLATCITESGAVAAVSVLDAEGSAPRDAGARMIVRGDGGFHGTIGGGALEWQAIAEAQRLLQGSACHRITRTALGPGLGQCCGGSVRLLIERFDATREPEVVEFAAREEAGPFTTRGRVTDGGVVRDLTSGALADGHLLEHFGERTRPLMLFGAGHVGRAVMLALAPLPFEVTWVDSRPRVFPAAVPANVTMVRTDHPAAMVANAPTDAFVLVLTHSHALDLEIVQAALEAGCFGYVGLIGSATKRTRFIKRLVEAGIERSRVDRDLVCPIGQSAIRSKTPAAIAAGIAADLLARDETLAAGQEDLSPRAVGVSAR